MGSKEERECREGRRKDGRGAEWGGRGKEEGWGRGKEINERRRERCGRRGIREKRGCKEKGGEEVGKARRREETREWGRMMVRIRERRKAGGSRG